MISTCKPLGLKIGPDEKEGWTSQDWLRVEKAEEAKKRNQSIDWLRFEKYAVVRR